MKSHTVPERLLKQFSYYNQVLRSQRLWQYEKGQRAHGKASPTSATRVDGIYSSPDDASFEKTLEERLAQQVEQPVNNFIADIEDPAFVLTDDQRHSLARYVYLLFQRTQARKTATSPLMDVKIYAQEAFLRNEKQVATVAAHWNIRAHFEGRNFRRLITPEDVAKQIRKLKGFDKSPRALQKSFAEGLAERMAYVDPKLYSGEWGLIRTTPDNPYILSDAPVITFRRIAEGSLHYGVGFHEEGVEVALPISPTVCLHALPAVRRPKTTQNPTPHEINVGEASFAFKYCFCDRHLSHLDKIMQNHGARFVMGRDIFYLPKERYDNIFYETLMSQ